MPTFPHRRRSLFFATGTLLVTGMLGTAMTGTANARLIVIPPSPYSAPVYHIPPVYPAPVYHIPPVYPAPVYHAPVYLVPVLNRDKLEAENNQRQDDLDRAREQNQDEDMENYYEHQQRIQDAKEEADEDYLAARGQ